jgi:spore germination cell wall hydrolase CwlJ-like protein
LALKLIGRALGVAIRATAFGVVALSFAAVALPSHAQSIQVAEVPQIGVLPSAAEQLAPAAGAPALTSALLANYIAKKQGKSGFDIFGQPPQPELTSAVLSAYAAAHYQNAALTAIDGAVAPEPLGNSFTAADASALTEQASEVSSITGDALAAYARAQFEPTNRKVARAQQERLCLSKAIYHEARGESDNGQWAVANVIINRALSKRFPTTMCGVIYQNADQGRNRCQFSFACDGQPDMARERQAWLKANNIAAAAYSEFQHGKRPGIVPGSALYYHTTSVSTDWGFKQVAQIGAHVFYSPM